MNQSHVLRSFGPRSMFFSARDLLLDNPAVSGVALNKEQSARQHLVNEAVSACKLLISSADAIRPFDALGNVKMAGEQIEEARDHALRKINNLLEAIERTNSRVRAHDNSKLLDQLNVVATEDTTSGKVIREELAAIAAAEGLPPAVNGIKLTSNVPSPADLARALPTVPTGTRWMV